MNRPCRVLTSPWRLISYVRPFLDRNGCHSFAITTSSLGDVRMRLGATLNSAEMSLLRFRASCNGGVFMAERKQSHEM
jgi:hypothetical protein